MRTLPKLFIFLSLMGALTAGASFVVEQQFASRAKLVQRVVPSDASDLFGDVGENIGSPQELIIDDPKAFLNKKSPEGAEYVNETYLKEKGIYPLQLQTVRFTASVVRMAGFADLVVCGALALILRRRLRS